MKYHFSFCGVQDFPDERVDREEHILDHEQQEDEELQEEGAVVEILFVLLGPSSICLPSISQL